MTSLKLNEVKNYLIRDRADGHRIRTIYLKLRRMDKFTSWSDIVLLNSIIEGLKELNLPYSKKEVHAVFKEIGKDDYEKKDKTEIMKYLTNEAGDKSVFKINSLA